MHRLLKTKKSDSEDDKKIEEMDTDDDSKDNVAGEDGDSDYIEEDDELEVPDDYIFPSYFAFVSWGPFALLDNCLLFLNTTDSKASVKVTQATMRKGEMKKNKVERESTTSAVRGFSTDQRISIEQLNIQK